MRILVDLNRCESYVQCMFAAPTVFRLIGRQPDHQRNAHPAAAARGPLVQDPPPYRQNATLHGPRHLLVEIDGVRD